MSSKTSVKLDSRIFNRSELRRTLSKIVQKSAKEFVPDVQEKMENSPHTGTVVTKARGENFRVRHQQSKRGERPAPFSKDLLNSLQARGVGEFTAQVDSTSEYADKLIFEDGRIIVSNEDLKEAEKKQQKEANAALKNLL